MRNEPLLTSLGATGMAGQNNQQLRTPVSLTEDGPSESSTVRCGPICQSDELWDRGMQRLVGPGVKCLAAEVDG